MIEGKYLYGNTADLSEVYRIRRSVYVEENGVPEDLEFDGYDSMCVHAVISVKGKYLGTGRLIFDGDEYSISHIAILKEERSKHYGDFLVRMLIDKAFLSGANEIYVNAKESAVGFYKKIGFTEIDGNIIEKDNTKRIRMRVSRQTLCKECQK